MINTVLGKINKGDLGITLVHEHIFVGSDFIRKALGKRWLDEKKLISLASEKLLEAKEKANLSTIVDGTPIDYGRDLDIIREVSLKSGVNIIYSTGLYYDEYSIFRNKTRKELSNIFLTECKHGSADCNNSNKTFPGILKCATGSNGVTTLNKKYLLSIGHVQKQTKLPLFIHAEHTIKSAYQQLEILKSIPVDFSKTIVGHCSDTDNIKYLESLIELGCFIGFDRINCSQKQVETFIKLVNKGFADKLLLSCDSCIYSDFSSIKNGRKFLDNPYLVVLEKFCAMLNERDVSNDLLKIILCDNPINLWN